MATGIYQILNKQNEKVYIGSAVNFAARKSHHLSFLRRNKHHNRKLQNAFNKYGENSFSFELIQPCDRAYLYFMEQIFINGYNACEEGYNIAPFVKVCTGIKRTEETKRKISLAKLGGKNPRNAEWNKNLNEAISKAWTTEKREKQRVTRTGRKHSEDTKAKIAASKVGKPRSDELKAKISAYRKGRKLSEAHKAAISAGGKRRYEVKT